MNKTLIYITDNSLAPEIETLCKRVLLKEAGNTPIVSVSQKPIDLGTNICVGEIGRSWQSLYTQLMRGIEAVKTKYVAICEHDCLYTSEHLAWEPPSEEIIYYNHNVWFASWPNGPYFRCPNRFALSQLTASKQILREGVTKRVAFFNAGYSIVKGVSGTGEPGVKDTRAMVRDGSYAKLDVQQSAVFNTILPNIDIRHSTNFTGRKKGIDERSALPYWGKFTEVMVWPG